MDGGKKELKHSPNLSSHVQVFHMLLCPHFFIWHVEIGANRYYYMCLNDLLALGGGGNFALSLDGDL